MNKKTTGLVLIILGVLMVAFDLLAIPLGLAAPGYGWKQTSLMVVGFVALGAGLMLSLSKTKKK
jgi:hypothetical protein